MPGDYLDLAIINLGEAITTLGNIRQRGGKPGSDFADVQLALRRVSFALDGVPYEPPPDAPQHAGARARIVAE